VTTLPRISVRTSPSRKKSHLLTFEERIDGAIASSLDSRFPGLVKDLTDAVAERLHPEKDKD
jgi:hypothetical protein